MRSGRGPRVLAIATLSQSLALQSPASWDVLNDAGADITFAAGRDEWTDRLTPWGTYVDLPGVRRLASLDHLRFLHACNRLINSRRWDLIQLQTPIASTLTRLTPALNQSGAVLYVAHGFHFHRDASGLVNFGVLRLERLLARRCDAVAVVANEDFVDAIDAGMDQQTLVWHLPGAGLDTSSFASAEPELPFGEPHALFCGDLIRRKNPLRVIDTALELLSRGKPVPLLLIGTGPLLDDVLDRAAPLREQQLFRHLTRTDRVAGYMAGAGAHLLPSWQEGVPRVTMEAMAAGVPTVAMSNRGSRELSERGAGPVLPRTSDAGDWATAVASCFGTRLDSRVAVAVEYYGLDNFRRSYRCLLESIGVVPSSID